MKKINKIFIPLATVALLASCGSNANANNVNETPVEEGTQLNLKESSKDSYAYNALTSIRLLSLSDDVTGDSSEGDITPNNPIEGEGDSTPAEPGEGDVTPEDPSQEETPSEDEVDPNLEIINNYLNMYDNLINGDGVLVSETLVSDKEGYTNMLVIKAKEISGEQTTYTLYFNEVNLEEDVDGDEVVPDEETPADPEAPNEDNPVTSEEVQTSEGVQPSERHGGHGHRNKERTLIEGLLVAEDLEVEVRGFNEIDEDETETILKARLEDGTSIRIKQESENDESSFSYTVRKNHKTVIKNKISIEKDENETELKVTYYNAEEETYESYSFKEVIEESTRYMKIHYNVDGTKGIIRIFFETDEEGNVTMTYYLSNGHSYHHDHDGWHNGHGHGHGHGHGDYEDEWDDYDWDEFDEFYWGESSEDDYFDWDEFFSEYFESEDSWDDDHDDDYEDDDYDDDDDDDYWDDYYDHYYGDGYGHGHGHGNH